MMTPTRTMEIPFTLLPFYRDDTRSLQNFATIFGMHMTRWSA